MSLNKSLLCAGGLLAVFLAASTVSADWQAGVDAFNKRDYKTAESEFEAVTQTNPDYPGAYYMLGLAQNGLKKRSQAAATLRRALELDPGNVSYKISLGDVLLKLKEYQDSYELLKPIALSAVDARFRSRYALVFAKAATNLNRASEAISVLNSQIRSDPKNPNLLQALGSAHSANGDDDRAFDAYKKAFDLNSKDEASGRNAAKAALSVARRASGEREKVSYYTKAAEVAERLVSVKATFDHTLLAGESWLGAKQYSKALSWFDKAQQQQSKNALVRFYKGQCYSKLGRFDTALNELREALSLSIGTEGKLRTNIYNSMGYAYAEKQEFDEAIKAYDEVNNQKMVQEMRKSKEAQAQNVVADAEAERYRRQVEALRHQMEELEKLGGSEDDVELLRQQLEELEKGG